MSKTIEISRDLADRIEQALLIGLHDSSPIVEEWRALLAAPVVERQEPVAEVVSKFGDPEAFGEREIVVLADLSKIPYDTKLYASPPAPEVAELLRDAYEDGYSDGQSSPNGYGDKADRDKCVARLLEPNP